MYIFRNGETYLGLFARRLRHQALASRQPFFSKSNAWENAEMLLDFNNTAIANVGNAGGLLGSSVAGSWYVGAHTADPGEAGDQTTSEASYTGYSRTAIARSGAGFTVAGNQASNAAIVSLGACTGGSNTLTHWSLGVASSGASLMRSFGPIIAASAIWLPFTAIAAGDLITVPGHTFSVDDRICFAAAYSGTLAAGITAGTVYWVKTVSGNDITISATQGGAAIDITAAGSGTCIKCQPIAVSASITPQFAIGALVIAED